ncbi:MAG TPA: sigma-70 family RNA polymerase sigma factor [Nitriliruptorales bacterium]
MIERVTSEAASVEALHEAYRGPLYVFALRALGDGGAAEEVVQDTLLRAWQHADRYDPDRGSVETWVFTIARNLITDRHRRRGVRPRTVASVDEIDLGAEDVRLDRVLEAWQVAEGLSGLTDDHRDAIVATYYRGLSIAEAADHLGIPEGTVKSRVYYGLRALRLRFEEMGGGPVTDHPKQREALGPYVIGALAPAERRDVEAHLESCGSCRDELARLSVLPALLARLAPDEVLADLPTQVPDIVPGLLAAVARERGRAARRLALWRAGAVAAAVAAVLIGWSPWSGGAGRDVVRAVAHPVAADAGATEGTVDAFAWEWGTTVALEVDHLPERDAYVLWVVSDDGRRQQAGTWGPTAARAATLRGAAAIARDQIARIEVTDNAGQVLFAFDLRIPASRSG